MGDDKYRAATTVEPDPDIIDFIEGIDENGLPIWMAPADGHFPVPVGDQSTPPEVISIDDGQVHHHGRPVSAIPNERFSASRSSDELAQMIEDIRRAESGAHVGKIQVDPSGALLPAVPGENQNPSSTIPQERFAAHPVGYGEIRRLDPENVCDWRWHDGARGWSFTLRPRTFNDTDEYRFLARRDPSRRNEWYAYCLSPNLDHLVGHEHHLQRLKDQDDATVVCLRENFRGHETLQDLHGALAKWCLYIGFIIRGLPAPFSV